MMAGFLFMLSVLAAPPLTDTQQGMLEQATDGAFVDEPALYGLLDNAVAWEAGDEAGATIPNYSDLLANPAAHRGSLFLIEGEFARARRFGLQRPGPWGDAVTEWGIRVATEPEEVVMVFFIDPAGEMSEPRLGERVRVAGRFFKVWGDKDLRGEPAEFAVFVARSAKRLGGGRADWPGMPQLSAMVLALAIVLGAGLPLLWVLRKSLRRPIAPRRLHHREAEVEELEPHETIDPAEALEKMDAGN